MAKHQMAGLAERLKDARTRVRPEMLQRDAAKAMGRTAACISSWESGNSEPSYVDLFQLAVVYKTKPQVLLGLEAHTESVPLLDAESIPAWDFTQMRGSVQAAKRYDRRAAALEVKTDAVQAVRSGDTIVIEEADEAQNGDIYLILPHGHTVPTLRRARLDGNSVRFVADDPMFQSYNNDDSQVIGRISEVIRRSIL